MSDANPIEVGSQIAPHLKLAAVLGEGGMARVFEAHHTRLNASVAVKVLTLTGDSAAQAGWRLVREAHICARIEDAHIPRVYDVAELPDGRPYVVMEKVTGPTLEQYMLDGTPKVASVITVARELLLALKAVHRAGVVHRDVKPGNVILQRVDGRVKGVRLMDFGIAHVESEAGDPSTMTSPGMVVGTPGYMAPEQVHADCVDGRADLYSLGVVIYEMLTGSLPFTNPDSIARLRATIEENVPDVRKIRRDCPPSLAEFVARATRCVRGERFSSAEEMLEALCACERELAAGPVARKGVSGVRKLALMGVGAGMVTALWWAGDPGDLPVLRASDEGASSVAPEPLADLAFAERAAHPAAPAASAEPASALLTTHAGALSLRTLGGRAQLPGAEAAGEESAEVAVEVAEPEASAEQAEAAPAPLEQDVEPAASSDEDGRAREPRSHVLQDASGEDAPRSIQEPQPADKGVLVSDYLRKLDALQQEASASVPAPAEQQPGASLAEKAGVEDAVIPDNPYYGSP